jgi:predicted kinase
MKKVYLTLGLPASGKSTWAKQKLDESPNSIKRINKDDLRAMLDNAQWFADAEKFVLKVRDTLILMALEDGKHVIVDDTNLHPKHEKRIRDLVKGKAEVELVDFRDVPIEVCIERDLKRLNSVGEKVIREMHRRFIVSKSEKPIYNPALPPAIICDLDGTLALLNGRNPYDAASCEDDVLNLPVYEILTRVGEDKTILLVSGREGKFKPQTERWLKANAVRYDALIMRETGDTRKDSVIKKEIYDTRIKPNYNVQFVLDDRNQVVDMWRSEGLTCLQVDYGDF